MKQKSTNALTIDCFDGFGNRGIQSDIKIFTNLQCNTMSVITVLPVPNFDNIDKIFVIQPDCIIAQCKSIFKQNDIHVVKIGSLFNAESVLAVVDVIKIYKPKTIVFNPNLYFNKKQHCDTALLEAIITQMIPIVNVIVLDFNIASFIANHNNINLTNEIIDIAYKIIEFGCDSVIIKEFFYNKNPDLCQDFIVTKDGFQQWLDPYDKIKQNTNDGYICKFSAALAFYMTKEFFILDAAQQANQYILKYQLQNKVFN